ncbi:hypothetical protein K7432_014609, partial [Basidiobolus ranarum]
MAQQYDELPNTSPENVESYALGEDDNSTYINTSDESIDVERNTEMFRDLERRISRASTKHSLKEIQSKQSMYPNDPEKGPQQEEEFSFQDYLESGVRAADQNGIRRHHMGVTFKNLTIV